MVAGNLVLYLPVPGSDAWVSPRIDRESELGAATRHLAKHLSDLAVELSTADSSIPTEVHGDLTSLAAAATSCWSRCGASLAGLAAANNEETSRMVTLEALSGRTSAATIERYLVYDKYFKVVRIRTMDDEQMLAQILVVAARLLADLPYAFLARDVIISILIGLTVMMSGDGDWDEGEPLQPGSLLSAAPGGTKVTDPLYRWIVGHHFQFLTTGYCRRFVDYGLDLTRNGENRAAQIGLAGSLLRATTGAMWYASELSPAVYLNHVRPSMPIGFSGAHNPDHVLLEASKHALVNAAMAVAKEPESPGEYEMLANIEQFLELDLENTEAHTLIAASKVGRHASLAQHAAVGRNEAPPTAAVDVLRALAAHKQSIVAAFFRSRPSRQEYEHSRRGRQRPADERR